jgi:hypothetical protein
MSEDSKPRKTLSLKKKVTEESSTPTSRPRFTLGFNQPREKLSLLSPLQKTSLSKSAPQEKDVEGKIEVTLKLNQLPNWVYRGKNDEHQFHVNGGGYIFEVRVRPRTWQKLLQAQQDYPAWTAAITGQLGERIKKGFRLRNASIQIYESQVKSSQPED